MATYLKGVTDVIPKQPEVKLDYDLLSKSLGALQGRYDSAYKSWKSMYNSLLSAELSSTDNEQFRADFMKKADAALSQVAGIDLANGANLQQAMTIFDPLVNDQQYVRDLYLTKTQRQQFSKMNQFKNSTDPKLQAQYNPIMEQYLGIGMQRLSEMKRGDGSIEKATVNMFSPWQDPLEFARAAAKEQGLEIKTTTPNGEWMVTEINGGKTVDTYRNWFRNTIGSKFDNQFRIEAEVDTENVIRSKMAETKLDRGTVMQQMAQEYSATYVKDYNEDMASLESQINNLNSQRRKLEKKYPNPSQQVIEQNNAMKQQKEVLQKQLDDMRSGKIDDAQLQKKATDIFMSSPSSVYVGQVRNRYADRFAYNQAYGKMELKYEPNQIWMHKSTQAHQWAMQKDSQRFTAEQNKLKAQWDVTLAAAKGELKGTGAEIGQKMDVGALDPYSVYSQTVTENFGKSVKAYTNDKVLAVAANMTIDKNGGVITKSNEPDLQTVQAAMEAKASGKALTGAQSVALTRYLNMVTPNSRINPNSVSFTDIQNMITNAVRTNSGLNPEYGAAVWSTLLDANLARQEYEKMFDNQSKHLKTITDPELTKYIKTDALGNKTINDAAVNAISDADEKELVYRSLMGSEYDMYASKGAKQQNTIVLNPLDPNKFDYSVLSSAINNAERIGYTDATGNFVTLDETRTAEFRNKTSGGQNMQQAFDPKGTMYERKIVNGKDYIKVTIPLLRTSGENSASVAAQFGYLGSEVTTQNKIEMLVPVSKAKNLGGTTAVNINPYTGGPMMEGQQLGNMIMDLAGTSLVDRNTSWVTEGLLNSNTVTFPEYLKSSVENGNISIVGDQISVQIVTDDGSMQNVNLTQVLGVTASDLRANPETYDYQIRQSIENSIYNIQRASMTSSHNAINENRMSSGSSGSNFWSSNPF